MFPAQTGPVSKLGNEGGTLRISCVDPRILEKMEVAVGLEPTKTGFADQRLDLFGIATKNVPTQN